MTKKITNADGYERVLAFFVEQNDGRRHGAKTRMAEYLNVSRQRCDNWDGHGIPPKFVKKLAKLTGLRPEDILPEYFS